MTIHIHTKRPSDEYRKTFSLNDPLNNSAEVRTTDNGHRGRVYIGIDFGGGLYGSTKTQIEINGNTVWELLDALVANCDARHYLERNIEHYNKYNGDQA